MVDDQMGERITIVEQRLAIVEDRQNAIKADV